MEARYRLQIARDRLRLAEVLSPVEVETFAGCGRRWFYQYLLGLPAPASVSLGLGAALRTALAVNFRQKIESREDLRTEGVIGLFRRNWSEQQQRGIEWNGETAEAIGDRGEELVRLYMQEAAPDIQPAAVEEELEGVLAGVRIDPQPYLRDEAGTILEIQTAPEEPHGVDGMCRFRLATYSRLAPGATGQVRLDTLVTSQTPRWVSKTWEVDAADLQATDRLFPLAQDAMKSGCYMPNRNSRLCSRHHCPYWRRCEEECGGVVRES